jgi:23S rRNA-/tRNA-specific pseudouridylate synthase
MNPYLQQSSQLPLGRGVTILNVNEDGLVALNKPSGVLSHPNSAEDRKRSMIIADYDYDKEVFVWEQQGKAQRAWLINRLDSPTSGVVLVALNHSTATIIKREFASHRITKIYYALVKRTPKSQTGHWSDQLSKQVYSNSQLTKQTKTIVAKTRFQIVKSPHGGFPISLIKLLPATGRTHQLRVQCQKHGHPIVGDRTYGSFSFNREVAEETGERRMMLHSAETVVRYTIDGQSRSFQASVALPEAFQTVLNFRPGLRTGLAQQGGSKATSKLRGRRFKS